MSSNNLIIDKLQSLFSELSLILVANRREDIDYHISEVKYVVEILNECKKNNYINSNKVINEIKSIYNNLYPARGGLSDFLIWKAVFDERVKANEPLDRLSDEIWKILR